MGSRLVDVATGETAWGADPGTLLGLTTPLSGNPSRGARLAPSDEELAGGPWRLRPDGLLTSPWWFPHFDWLRPYARAISSLENDVGRAGGLAPR
jgi:hypothetical protein